RSEARLEPWFEGRRTRGRTPGPTRGRIKISQPALLPSRKHHPRNKQDRGENPESDQVAQHRAQLHQLPGDTGCPESCRFYILPTKLDRQTRAGDSAGANVGSARANVGSAGANLGRDAPTRAAIAGG